MKNNPEKAENSLKNAEKQPEKTLGKNAKPSFNGRLRIFIYTLLLHSPVAMEAVEIHEKTIAEGYYATLTLIRKILGEILAEKDSPIMTATRRKVSAKKKPTLIYFHKRLNNKT